jgi:hypothetical protein
MHTKVLSRVSYRRNINLKLKIKKTPLTIYGKYMKLKKENEQLKQENEQLKQENISMKQHVNLMSNLIKISNEKITNENNLLRQCQAKIFLGQAANNYSKYVTSNILGERKSKKYGSIEQLEALNNINARHRSLPIYDKLTTDEKLKFENFKNAQNNSMVLDYNEFRNTLKEMRNIRNYEAHPNDATYEAMISNVNVLPLSDDDKEKFKFIIEELRNVVGGNNILRNPFHLNVVRSAEDENMF